MSRWIEFFEGERNRLSMSRLLCFLAFWPATIVVLRVNDADTLGWYLGAFVLGYVGGKAAGVMGRNGGTNAKPD